MVVLSLIVFLGLDIMCYFFSGCLDLFIIDFVGIILVINIGWYIYFILVNVYFYGEGELFWIKMEVVYYVVIIVCYFFFFGLLLKFVVVVGRNDDGDKFDNNWNF